MKILHILTSNIRDVFEKRELISYMIFSKHKSAFFKSLIGESWYIIENIFNIGIYYFLLCIIYRSTNKSVVFFIIMTGMSHYYLFQGCIKETMQIFCSKEYLLKQIYVNPLVFVVATFLATAKKAFQFIAIIFILILVYKFSFDAFWAQKFFIYLVSLLTLFVMTFSVTLLLSIYQVYVRDLDRLVTVFLRVTMYLTPVLYGLPMLKNRVLMAALYCNPLTVIFVNIQACLLNNNPRFNWLILYPIVFSICIFLLSIHCFEKNKHKLIKYC